jgi:arabinan endo-1,5-alpha-L-arabinosidase
MSFTWGGVTYKGAFIVQNDEADTPVKRMCFTATGINICIWGSKTSEYKLTDDLVQNQTASKLVYNADPQDVDSAVYLADTKLLADVSYKIESRFSGMVLDLEGGKTENGANIQQWGYKAGSSHEEWRICNAGNGYVKILSMKNEAYALTENADNMELSEFTGADSQLFKLIEKRGSYGIVSKSSNAKNGLDVYGWSEEAGGNIASYEYWGGDCQLWNLTPVCPTVTDGSYYIRSVNSKNFLSVNADKSIVQESDALIWNVAASGTGYTLSCNAGIAALASASADGTDVIVSENGAAFTLYANADGSYTIMADGSEAVDVYGISKDAGANICLWNYWGGDGQKWVLIPADSVQSDTMRGDVNADGTLDVSDVILFQKWLLGATNAQLADWKAADLCEDGVLDIFDLCMMKRELLVKMPEFHDISIS